MNQRPPQQTRQTPAVRQATPSTPAPPLIAKEGGLEDAHRALEIGKVMAASGYFPDAASAAQAAVKIMMGQEIGVGPMSAMTEIYVIPGKGDRPPRIRLSANIEAQLMTQAGYSWKVIRLDDEVGVLEFYKDGELIVDGTDDKGKPKPARTTFDIGRARLAGLVKDYSPWKSGYIPDMLFARCITRGRKRYAPEVTAGFTLPVVTQEEVDEEPLDHAMRKAMFALAREKGVTEGQRAEITEKICPGVTSWAADGGLTNGYGRQILNYLETLADKDLFPELEASVKATSKVEGGDVLPAGDAVVVEKPPSAPVEGGGNNASDPEKPGAKPPPPAPLEPALEPDDSTLLAEGEPCKRTDPNPAGEGRRCVKVGPHETCWFAPPEKAQAELLITSQRPSTPAENTVIKEADTGAHFIWKGGEWVPHEVTEPEPEPVDDEAPICGEWGNDGEVCTLPPDHAPKPHSWAKIAAADDKPTEEQIATMRQLCEQLELTGMPDPASMSRQKAENMIELWSRRLHARDGKWPVVQS